MINYASLSFSAQPFLLLLEAYRIPFLVITYWCITYGRYQQGVTYSQIGDEGFEVKIFVISNCVEA
jgi:hypothetical protein